MELNDTSFEGKIVRNLKHLNSNIQSHEEDLEAIKAAISQNRDRQELFPTKLQRYMALVKVINVGERLITGVRVELMNFATIGVPLDFAESPIDAYVPQGSSMPAIGDEVLVVDAGRFTLSGGEVIPLYVVVAGGNSDVFGEVLSVSNGDNAVFGEQGNIESVEEITDIDSTTLYDHYYVKLFGDGLPDREVVEDEDGRLTATLISTPSHTEIVEVRQTVIAVGTAIPSGTIVRVSQVGDKYMMNVPVWL